MRTLQTPKTPPPDVKGDEVDLAALLRLGWAHKLRVALIALPFIGLAIAYVVLATPRYTATASLVLDRSQENVFDFKSVLPEFSSSDYQAMNTELLILQSRTLLGDVIDKMSLENDPEFNPTLRPTPAWKEYIGYDLWKQNLNDWLGIAPAPRPTEADIHETAIEILRAKIDVNVVPQTYAINVAVETNSPEKSADIANTMATVYIDSQLKGKFTALDHAVRWLSQRVTELEQELETAETKYRDFAASSVAPSDQLMLLQMQKIKGLRDELAEKHKTSRELRDRIARLRDLRAQGNFAALGEYTKDPQLQSLAHHLAEVGSNGGVLGRLDTELDRHVSELTAEDVRTTRRIASLERAINDFESNLKGLSDEFIKQQQLQREAEATRLIYEQTLARLKEISIQQGIQQSDARVLDPAKIPDDASHPRTKMVVGAGGFFGVFLGFLIVFVQNSLRRTFRSSEELERASQLPVVGIIPHVRARAADGVLKHIRENPAAPLAEGIRNLRTTIQLSNLDAPPQVVMLTSSVPGEGKSTLCAALGQASAQSGKRALVIDADLRRRTLGTCFQIAKRPGLLSVLSGASSFDEAVWHDEQTHLDVLVADEGKMVTASDVFGSHRFQTFLREMRKIYDVVFIDTPPILAVSDTRVVAQHADAIVYVVRWNSTDQRMLRAGLNALWQVNAQVAGVVLSAVKAKGSQQYAYYSYSYT